MRRRLGGKPVLDDGDEAVGYDLGKATHRQEPILSEDERAWLTLVRGDFTDLDALLDEHEITRSCTSQGTRGNGAALPRRLGRASVGIRPYVVYGPGRDQGMTAGPLQAMSAAAQGEDFEIGYASSAQYDSAPAVGRAFVAASAASEGAVVGNFPGVSATMEDVVAAIEAAAPAAATRITWSETALPFPAELEARALESTIGPVEQTITRVRRENDNPALPKPAVARWLINRCSSPRLRLEVVAGLFG